MQSVAHFPILIVGASVVMQHFEVKARLQLKIEDSDPELTVGHAQFSEERYKEKEALRLALQLE